MSHPLSGSVKSTPQLPSSGASVQDRLLSCEGVQNEHALSRASSLPPASLQSLGFEYSGSVFKVKEYVRMYVCMHVYVINRPSK